MKNITVRKCLLILNAVLGTTMTENRLMLLNLSVTGSELLRLAKMAMYVAGFRGRDSITGISVLWGFIQRPRAVQGETPQ